MNLAALDSYLTSPPEPKVVGRCLRCNDDVHEGERVYHIERGFVCEDCFVEFAEDELGAVLADAE